MPKLPILKSKSLIKALKKMGFFKHHQVGSHSQFKHFDGRRITIPIHPGKEIPKGTLKAILRDLEISTDELVEFLKK